MTNEGSPDRAEKIETLKAELEVIYDTGYSAFGHGTIEGHAQKTFESGLKSQDKRIQSTMIPILDYDRSFEEQWDDLLERLEHWPHYNLSFIVIVMIPAPAPGDVGGIGHYEQVWEDNPDPDKDDKFYRKPWRVPGRYVIGYVDINKLEFVRNQEFNPQALPSLGRLDEMETWEPDEMDLTALLDPNPDLDLDDDVW